MRKPKVDKLPKVDVIPIEEVIQPKENINIYNYCELKFYNFSRCKIVKFKIYNSSGTSIVDENKNLRNVIIKFINNIDINEFIKYSNFTVKFNLPIDEYDKKVYSYIEKHNLFLSYKNNNFTINEIARLCDLFDFSFEFKILLKCDKYTNYIYFKN